MTNSKELIRKAIAINGITQEELAHKVGYKYQSGLGNVLNSEDDMMVSTLVRIMKACNCEVLVYDKKRDGVLGEITADRRKWSKKLADRRRRAEKKAKMEEELRKAEEVKAEEVKAEEVKEEVTKEEAKEVKRYEIPVYDYGRKK